MKIQIVDKYKRIYWFSDWSYEHLIGIYGNIEKASRHTLLNYADYAVDSTTQELVKSRYHESIVSLINEVAIITDAKQEKSMLKKFFMKFVFRIVYK